MKIGIGLPSTVPGTEGGDMRDWALRTEAAGFSSLGTIDRTVHANHEPLTALAFAAGRDAAPDGEYRRMHPELRRARSLHHAARAIPPADRARISPAERERLSAAAHAVKELALDLRGHVDERAPLRELARANAALEAALAAVVLRRAA